MLYYQRVAIWKCRRLSSNSSSTEIAYCMCKWHCINTSCLSKPEMPKVDKRSDLWHVCATSLHVRLPVGILRLFLQTCVKHRETIITRLQPNLCSTAQYLRLQHQSVSASASWFIPQFLRQPIWNHSSMPHRFHFSPEEQGIFRPQIHQKGHAACWSHKADEDHAKP